MHSGEAPEGEAAEHRGAGRVLVVVEPRYLAGGVEAGIGVPAGLTTRAELSVRIPPNVNVIAQVSGYATNGGESSGKAQFDFGGARPRVLLPSKTYGSNGSGPIAALYSETVCSSAPDRVRAGRELARPLGGDRRHVRDDEGVEGLDRERRLVADEERGLLLVAPDLVAERLERRVEAVPALVEEPLCRDR